MGMAIGLLKFGFLQTIPQSFHNYLKLRSITPLSRMCYVIKGQTIKSLIKPRLSLKMK